MLTVTLVTWHLRPQLGPWVTWPQRTWSLLFWFSFKKQPHQPPLSGKMVQSRCCYKQKAEPNLIWEQLITLFVFTWFKQKLYWSHFSFQLWLRWAFCRCWQRRQETVIIIISRVGWHGTLAWTLDTRWRTRSNWSIKKGSHQWGPGVVGITSTWPWFMALDIMSWWVNIVISQ